MNSSSHKSYVCVLSFENIAIEYRVRNQVHFLSKNFFVDFIGIGDWEYPKDINYIKLNRTPKTFLFYFVYIILLSIGRLIPHAYKFIFKLKPEYIEAKRLIQSRDYDIIHANEWDSLFISIDACINKQTKIIFDAHEFSTEQQSELFLWRILVKPFRHWLFNKYLHKVDKIITVSDSIAKLYEKVYEVKNVSVIYNTWHYIKNKFRKTNSKCIKIIHHGGAIRNRSLELFFELSNLLDNRFKIHLMLIPHDKRYYQCLKNLSEKHSEINIEIIDSVDNSQINKVLINYDIGLPAISASNINHLFALGRKVFDFIIAGLAIAVPPLYSYKEIIDKYQIGVVGKDMAIESLANILNNTSAKQFDEYKNNSLIIAKHLNLNHENIKLLKIYNELLSG